MSTPKPRFRDHLQVALLLVLTLLGIVPVVLWIAFSWLLKPLVRGAMRRRLVRMPDHPADPPAPDPSFWAGRTVFVVAGEPSGDALASRVVRALKARCPDARVRGYAGPLTAAAGADLDQDIVEHAVVGVSAVIGTLGFWWRLCAETLARFRTDPPDVLLTVDFPGLNARLARWAKKQGIVTVHLVPPSVWGYMPWRIVRWRRAVDHMLTIFPFEPALFEGSGIPSTFVGHPLFEAPLAPPRTPASRPSDAHGSVELLPGSRRQELRLHAPVLLDAAAVIEDRLGISSFDVRLARAEHQLLFEQAAASARRRPTTVRFLVGEDDVGEERGEGESAPLPLLGAVACSGTVTAELAAALVPMTVYYRMSPWLRFGAFVGLIAPYFALANLCAGREVVPERLQVSASGTHVAEDFLRVVGTPESWQTCRDELDTLVRQRIGVKDVADRAARALLAAAAPLLQSPSPRSTRPVGESGTSSNPAGGPS